jgi:hypothetical protein
MRNTLAPNKGQPPIFTTFHYSLITILVLGCVTLIKMLFAAAP